MKRKIEVYTLPKESDIATKIKANFGLQRLFRETSTKAPYHTPIVLTRYILRVSVKENKPYTQDNIYRLITSEEFKQQQKHKLYKEEKQDLYCFSKEAQEGAL